MSDNPKVILEDELGNKVVQVGEIQIGGYTDKLILVLRPDGTYRSEQPVPLQRFLKFSCKAIWRKPLSKREKAVVDC